MAGLTVGTMRYPMTPGSDYKRVVDVHELMVLEGYTVLVRPRDTSYGFVPAVIQHPSATGQWLVCYLSHDRKRVIHARQYVKAIDILDDLCVMRFCG